MLPLGHFFTNTREIIEIFLKTDITIELYALKLVLVQVAQRIREMSLKL